MFNVADTAVGTVGVKRRICGVLGTKLVAEPSSWRTLIDAQGLRVCFRLEDAVFLDIL